MTVDLLLLLFARGLLGKRWVVAMFPHPYWGKRLATELYARLGPERFLRMVRVEDLDTIDKVIMRRFIGFSGSSDPWTRRRENEEHLAILRDSIGRSRNIVNWAERPVLDEGLTVGGSLQQNLNLCKEAFFPECNLGFVFSKENPERLYRMGYCTDPEIKAKLASFGAMSPHDDRNILAPIQRLFGAFLRSPLVMARTTREPRWRRVPFMRQGGIYIVIGGNDSPEALRRFVSADFAEVMAFGKAEMIGHGYYLLDEPLNYGLWGPYESRALSTMRAFIGADAIWHAVQSSDYPTEEIARNVNQNCDQYIFRQGDDEEAMKASKLLLGSLDRMREHHRDTLTRQVNAGFDEVSRGGKSVTRDDRGQIIAQQEQQGTQLVARYAEVKEERIHYESGQEQILWQAQELLRMAPGTCWVRRGNERPFLKRVDWFPDSWAFRGDPQRGIPPLWETKFHEAMTLLGQLPEYEMPVDLPVPVPDPKPAKKEAPKPRGGKTAGEMMRGKGTNGSGRSSRSTR